MKFEEFFNYLQTLDHFTEYTETIVDGIVLDADDNFQISIDWVVDKYKLFNQKYFSGKLPDLNKDKVIITYENLHQGMTEFDTAFERKTLDLKYCELIYLELSNYRQLSEKDYAENLLHEMLHYYRNICFPLNYWQALESHDKVFLAELDKLNSKGWDIPVISLRKKKPSKEALDRLSLSYLIVAKHPTKLYRWIVFQTSPRSIPFVKEFFKEKPSIYKISNAVDFAELPYIDSIDRVIKYPDDILNIPDIGFEELVALNTLIQDKILQEKSKKLSKDDLENYQDIPPELLKFISDAKGWVITDVYLSDKLDKDGDPLWRIRFHSRC